MIKRSLLAILFFVTLCSGGGANGSENNLLMASNVDLEGRAITFDEFVRNAGAKDTEFDEILVDQLDLKYQKALSLPAGDFVVSVKDQLVAFVDEIHSVEKGETTVAISKLFPGLGTELEASYEVLPHPTTEHDSTFSFSVTQPIAENAFGHSTRLLDKIVGIEIDIAAYQIAEAYEDYLATVSLAYLDWFEAYENLKIGQSSYTENLKLLDNIKEREKSKIALPIDVNKITLQVMAKKEKFISLEEDYFQKLNIIRRMIRSKGDEAIVPVHADIVMDTKRAFDEEFEDISAESRTYRVLDLLLDKSSLEVDRAADDLLPSINVLFQIDVDGTDYAIERKERTLFGGLQMEWPLPDVVQKAEHETAKIEERRTKYYAMNTDERLYTQLKNLHREICMEKNLILIAKEKIELARQVLNDEAENYRFGKTTLNDYIQAVNALDDNRFSHILHESNAQKLIIEYRRLADLLVSEKDINKG